MEFRAAHRAKIVYLSQKPLKINKTRPVFNEIKRLKMILKDRYHMAMHVLLRGHSAGKAGHESSLVLLVGIQPRHSIFLLDILCILALN